MPALMLAPGVHQLQVFDPVVSPVVIEVVDTFGRLQDPAEVPFHHKAVFFVVPMRVRLWMTWGPDENVASAAEHSAAAPFRIALANIGRQLAWA